MKPSPRGLNNTSFNGLVVLIAGIMQLSFVGFAFWIGPKLIVSLYDTVATPVFALLVLPVYVMLFLITILPGVAGTMLYKD